MQKSLFGHFKKKSNTPDFCYSLDYEKIIRGPFPIFSSFGSLFYLWGLPTTLLKILFLWNGETVKVLTPKNDKYISPPDDEAIQLFLFLSCTCCWRWCVNLKNRTSSYNIKLKGVWKKNQPAIFFSKVWLITALFSFNPLTYWKYVIATWPFGWWIFFPVKKFESIDIMQNCKSVIQEFCSHFEWVAKKIQQ